MNFLPQVVVFLVAACVAVPLARKSSFGSVLGYLIAGPGAGPELTAAGVLTDILKAVQPGC